MDDLDQECIICTLNLPVAPRDLVSFSDHRQDAGVVAAAAASTAKLSIPTSLPPTHEQPQIQPIQHAGEKAVAVIQPCNHFLHDECLREWSQIANTCPLCRQAFNLVQVHDAVGGTLLSTYAVEDKKQVATFDPNAWIQEEEDEEDESVPCPICNESDQLEILLMCDACDANYHTHCVGLDDIPDGDWFCMECAESGAYQLAAEAAAAATRPEPIRGRRRPRTQAIFRRSRRRMRNDGWLGPWNQIGHRIHGATGLDIDFSEDEDFSPWRRLNNHTNIERRQREVWRTRLNIARRQGADRAFREAAPPSILPRVPTPVETPEESMAWGDFEKAKEIDTTSQRGRKRKSRSVTASPRAPAAPGPSTQFEPERKFKRPRTRRVLDCPGLAVPSIIPNSSSQVNGIRQASQENGNGGDGEPSFLSSLLREVDMASGSEDGRSMLHSTTLSAPNRITSPSVDYSSPATSPACSSYPTPRAMSMTPPPHLKSRSRSPLPLTSRVEPVFPPADYSPSRSLPATRPEAPRSPITELRQPRPRRRPATTFPQSDDVSPIRASSPISAVSPARAIMSIEIKEDISKIVKSALAPHWKSAEITKSQYGDINRDVSRKLYEILVDCNLADEKEKHRCEKIAIAEVATAVRILLS